MLQIHPQIRHPARTKASSNGGQLLRQLRTSASPGTPNPAAVYRAAHSLQNEGSPERATSAPTLPDAAHATAPAVPGAGRGEGT
ncbi:hypothetical protein [Streptomyces sp. NBC_00233]|uniref:hypothetical protein n=1 Tax=Streptomyces sp. NBC_00233 TaxID=2975686 RepID=UPI00224DFE62|nr:hypothetical protein [Streptomyces sp. NBC_00233]MCX5233060.1 hypothetical protein [Streptomyces sp. NBC_00233]